MASRSLVVCVVVVALLACLLYEPIPKGYSSASTVRLRVLAATVKVVKYVALISDTISPGSQIAVRRAACRLAPLSAAPYDTVRTHDTEFDGVPVRIYEPVGRKGSLPGIVYYHGGGFVVCDVESFDRTVRKLSELTNTVIASVNYRLAPEHYYPAAHEDCVTATKFFIKNAKRFNVDPTRVAVAGDSAGGNLAATVSLRLRDEQYSPPIKLQVLIFPTVQLIDLTLPSMLDNKIDPALKMPDVSYYYSIYLNLFSHRDTFASNDHVPGAVRQKLAESYIDLDKLPSQYTAHITHPKPRQGDQKLWAKIKPIMLNPYFAPLLAPKLSDLPRAFVYAAEYDVLRDDGILYAERLREAGVKVELFTDPLGFHNNFLFALEWPEVDASMRRMAEYITEHL